MIASQVTTDSARTNIIDNYVLEGADVQNNNLDRLYIGNRSGGRNRAYVRFATMPTIPEGAIISSATLTLKLLSGTSSAYAINAYQILANWDSSTIKWSNRPSASTLVASNVGHNNLTKYSIPCTSAVQSWYNGSTSGQNANYGIMLRYYDETVADYNAVYSADCSTESKRPSITITYQLPGESLNGVYFIKCGSLYLSVDQGMIAGSTLELLAKKSGGPAQLRQLWKIEYGGQNYYTIRSAYDSALALNVTGNVVDMAFLSTTQSSSDVPNTRKWKITQESGSYTLQYRGNASQTMQTEDNALTAGTAVIAGEVEDAQYNWTLESSSVTNQVLLINTEVGLPATNAVREITLGETLTLTDLRLTAVFVSSDTNSQNIQWNSSDTSVATVDTSTGTVTGVSEGQTTITANRTYNNSTYSVSYTMNVLPVDDSSSFENPTTIQLGNSAFVSTSVANELIYFKFVPTETATYIIQSSNPSGDPRVWLYDSSETLLENNNNSGGDLNFRLSRTLTANRTYYIAAGHAASKTGSYRITVLKPVEIENRFYRAHNVGSLLYLDIEGPANQEFVHQWSYHTDPQSSWLIQKESDSDYYTIRSQFGDNLYIGISNTNTGESNIKLYSSISDATRWRIYVTNLGRYLLEPKNAMGKVLYAPNSSEGSRMQLAWLGSGNRCQWNLQQYAHTGKTFSAFDVGDSEEDEVALVKSAFDTFGYTDLGTYNNAEVPVSAQLIKDISRYSDIVYINGHGGRKANLWIKNAAGDTIEHLCAESSVDLGDSLDKVEMWLSLLVSKAQDIVILR